MEIFDLQLNGSLMFKKYFWFAWSSFQDVGMACMNGQIFQLATALQSCRNWSSKTIIIHDQRWPIRSSRIISRRQPRRPRRSIDKLFIDRVIGISCCPPFESGFCCFSRWLVALATVLTIHTYVHGETIAEIAVHLVSENSSTQRKYDANRILLYTSLPFPTLSPR